MGNIRVDRFYAATNPEKRSFCFYFYGSYWRGCPKLFLTNQDNISKNINESLDVHLERTRRVNTELKSLENKLIEK